MNQFCDNCYFNIFKNSYIGILILDKDLKVKAANRAFLNILHVKENEILNQNFLNYIDKEYEQLFLDSFLGLLKDDSFTFNVELELNSDKTIWVDVHASALKSSESVAVFMDNVTEKKYLEIQNIEKEYMLIQQSKLAQMGEMLSMITHQWKQPLNNINTTILNLEFRKEFDTLSDICVNEAIESIQNQVNNMANIINTFTGFLKPNRDMTEFNLYASIKKIFDLMHSQLRLKSINTIIDIDKTLMIKGYESEFEQVVMNLIVNTRDAFEGKSIAKEIKIFSTAEDKKITLHFADNAGGIKSDVIEDVFKPYFSTKENGTGIGLYMSKLIIESHFGGTIEAKNVGEGAKFEITIVDPK